MSRHSRTKLVPPKITAKNQTLEALEETSLEQKYEQTLIELDHEIECLLCNDIMELNLNFDSLVYFCEM